MVTGERVADFRPHRGAGARARLRGERHVPVRVPRDRGVQNAMVAYLWSAAYPDAEPLSFLSIFASQLERITDSRMHEKTDLIEI